MFRCGQAEARIRFARGSLYERVVVWIVDMVVFLTTHLRRNIFKIFYVGN